MATSHHALLRLLRSLTTDWRRRRLARSIRTMIVVPAIMLTTSPAERAPARLAVSFNPAGGTFTSAGRQVTITWTKSSPLAALDEQSRSIILNGTNITSQFDYIPTPTGATSSATITLQPGDNVLQASICEGIFECGSNNATYTYLDGVPTASISPVNGTLFASASQAITITWTDDASLNGDSREVFLNGSPQTFNFSGGSTSATSTVTVQLQPGNNTLTARICDFSSNCSATVSATYVYDNVAPTASISPPSGVALESATSVTVTWSDNIALDQGSRQITFNGQTLNWGFTGSGGTGTSSGNVTLQSGVNTFTARICDSVANCSSTASVEWLYDVDSRAWG